MLTNQEITSVVETAFQPFRAAAEIWGLNRQLRFRVFGPDDRRIVEVPRVTLRAVRDKHKLSAEISLVRRYIEARGFKLEPWSLQ